MSLNDRERWEPRHEAARILAPRPSVLGLAGQARGRRVLDVACGQGRHALALADAGAIAVAFDISRNALAHLLSRAGGRILAVQGDCEEWPFAPASFDLVVQVDFLERRLFPSLAATLAPGGVLLIDTFAVGQHPNAEGPTRVDFLVRPGELAAAFAGFEILEDTTSDGPTARSVFVARRPRVSSGA